MLGSTFRRNTFLWSGLFLPWNPHPCSRMFCWTTGAAVGLLAPLKNMGIVTPSQLCVLQEMKLTVSYFLWTASFPSLTRLPCYFYLGSAEGHLCPWGQRFLVQQYIESLVKAMTLHMRKLFCFKIHSFKTNPHYPILSATNWACAAHSLTLSSEIISSHVCMKLFRTANSNRSEMEYFILVFKVLS